MRGGAARMGHRTDLWLAAPTAERRQAGRAVLAEGAAACGGQVEELPGAVILRGAEPDRARRLRDLLDRLMGGAVLLPPPGVPPDLAGLDAWLGALDPLQVARRRTGWRLAADVPRTAFLRLEIARDRLGRLLGPTGDDPDLLDHAVCRLRDALLRRLGDPAHRRALLGEEAPARLHLPLPDDPRAGAPGLVATVGLAAAADPDSLAARRAALAARGGALELEGLDAASLALIDAAALPADLLRLAWSPALAAAVLPPEAARRTILAGADAPVAQAWARRQRIAVVEADTPPA